MPKFELVNEKEICCGCGLCAAKCPKNAIEMKEDEYGFVFPYINKDKCIDCGLCKKVCAYNKKNDDNKFEKITYAAFSNDNEILNTTASGGIFTSIAKEFINQTGIVFGCSLEKENNKFIVKHIKVDKINDLEKLKGSKYVQSDITNIYKEIKECLKENKKVLFSGTPCQVAAIKQFTNNPDNLFTIDIICHGVPSNELFNNYINYINKKNNIEINDFKFRVKDKGWGLYYYYYNYYDNKKKKFFESTKPAFKSSYYQLFLDSYTYRENCYRCPYANDKRTGDITIGDYWGIDIEHPELINERIINPEKGVSCIVVNSIKGKKLLNSFASNIDLYESDLKKIKNHNHQLNNPSKKHNNREILLKDYKEYGYQSIENYYKNNKKIRKIVKNIWYKIPYKIRKKLKK